MHALRTISAAALRTHNQSAFLLTRAAARSPAPQPRQFLGGPSLLSTPSLPPAFTSTSVSRIVASVGFASGTLGALCGVGGAVFAIPGLVRYASLSQRVAAGNSLIAVTAIACTSAYSFANAGCVDTETAIILGGTASVFTPIGVRLSAFAKPHILRKGLGVFMVALAPLMPLRTWFEKGPSLEIEATNNVLGGIGSGVGLLSGLLGISGGSLFTPVIALANNEASFRNVLGTSFAAMIVPTAIGAFSYARMGCVTPQLVPPLVVGGVVGAYVGSTIALNISEEFLRWVFMGVFSILGMRIVRAPIKAKDINAHSKVIGATQR